MALAVVLASSALEEVRAQDFPLFVADYRGIGVYSLDAAGSIDLHGFVSGPLSSVRNDAYGNLYTCSEASGDVAKIDTAGTISAFVTGLTGCFGLLFASDGTLYVSDVWAGRIIAVPPQGEPITLASGLGTPGQMAFDRDGSILVNDLVGGAVRRVAAGGVSLVASGLRGPFGIAIGPDDNIYVSEFFSGQIARIDRDGQVSRLLAAPLDDPAGLDFHDDGLLFVAEMSAGQIDTVDIQTGAVQMFKGGLTRPAGLSFERLFVSALVRVNIDVRPGSDDNPLNPGSHGLLPVALLGRAGFDALQIDTESVRFGVSGIEAVPARSHAEDVNGDGFMDLVLHFATQSLGLGAETTSPLTLELTGQTLDGQAIAGEDVVRVVP